jgi:Outer membrane protein beta-barrel domain
MTKILRVALFVCVPLALPVPAAAQASPRFWIGVNGGYQPTTTEFDDRFSFELYRETATTRVTYPVDAGFLFDVGGGVGLWRGLGAGVAVSRFARDGSVSTSSSLPHPLFLQQNRELTGDADGLRREELGVHVQAQYQLPPIGRLQVTVMGGPSVFQVRQSMVTEVNYTEEYPYDSATFTGVDSRTVETSATGFNVGVDVRWMFTRNVGAGGLVRFTRATADLDAPGNRTISVDTGGTQIGAGVRFAF